MSIAKKIENVIISLLQIVCAVILVLVPEQGYRVVILILSVSLLIAGLKSVAYYLTMARHMVSGKIMLYESIILLDFGLFTMTLYDVPKVYILLYLVLYNLVSGAIDIASAMESKKTGAGWKTKFTGGAVDICFALLCIIFSSNMTIVVGVYSVGLVVSAVNRIWNSLRKTAIIYIQ